MNGHAHAPTAPSGLDLTVACNASVRLQASMPAVPETDEQAEGTFAHWVAGRYAEGRGRELPAGINVKHRGRAWDVTDDMVDGAIMFQEAMGAPHGMLRLEDPVAIPDAHPTCFGTPDGWQYFPFGTWRDTIGNVPPEWAADKHVIRNGDYKFGHRFVEVFECKQLTGYTFGVARRLGLDINDPSLWVEFIIVQPRSYHRDGPVRRWLVPMSRLIPVMEVIRAACHAALGPEPLARPGPHCFDCSARTVCTAQQMRSAAISDWSMKADRQELLPHHIGPELAILEDAADTLMARLVAMRALAEQMIREGKFVTNYHLERGQSRRKFREDVTVDEIVGIGRLYGIDLQREPTLKNTVVTPKQALDKGLPESVLNRYAYRPPAGMKLVRDDALTTRKVFRNHE